MPTTGWDSALTSTLPTVRTTPITTGQRCWPRWDPWPVGRCWMPHPVMDWLRKGGSYFQTVLETDIWHTPAGDQPVLFWRESLSALCAAATGAGFLIERLIEPLPAETMRERYPEDYEKLSREPGFLILRLLKPATSDPGLPI